MRFKLIHEINEALSQAQKEETSLERIGGDSASAAASDQPIPVRALGVPAPAPFLERFYKPVSPDEPRVAQFARMVRDEESWNPSHEHVAAALATRDMCRRLRRHVDMDKSTIPDAVRDTEDEDFKQGNIQTEARAGRRMVERYPDLCQRVAERISVQYASEQLRLTPSMIRFWALNILDDRLRGTDPSAADAPLIDRRRVRGEGVIIEQIALVDRRRTDNEQQRQRSYKDAIGMAALNLTAGRWKGAERANVGGASRRYSAAFNICRLVCADIIDEVMKQKVGFTKALINGGADEARLRAVLPAVMDRLTELSQNPALATRHLPRLDDND